MSAETLRKAAQRIREDWMPGDVVDDTFLAVADLLDAIAAEHASDSGNPTVDAFFMSFDTAPDQAAVAVARTYLGEDL